MKTILPNKKIHKTPRLLLADAYTVGSDDFQSAEAKTESVYYITYRRHLHSINPVLYAKGDDRIAFVGLQRILEKLFYEPITHEEIDDTVRFLATFKISAKGRCPYKFPEHLWRRVVDEFNGRPPIQIKALPEGSIVYPNEPCVQIRSLVDGFGEIAAWFESKLLQVWAASERVTQNQHWLLRLKQMVSSVDPNLSDKEVTEYASLMLTDFGDRAGMVLEESEELGMVHLYTFSGTDNCSGAYQAWKNSNELPIGCSVNALAHRNVEAYDLESDCYTAMYNNGDNGDILSMVADCYDFYVAVEKYILPLALRSQRENNGKILVPRPDSGDPKEQVLFVCRLAEQHGLIEYKEINGKTWKYATSLRFIEGDGMDFKTMWEIMVALMEEGFAPYGWGLFGVGGGLRNHLKRDNLSAKYALASIGQNHKGRIKVSETLGKGTLPGPFKVLRTPEALAAKCTILFESETGEDSLIEYFDGTRCWKPFGPGQDDDFITIQQRIAKQYQTMPLSLETPENLNYPASELIFAKKLELMKQYAPSKVK